MKVSSSSCSKHQLSVARSQLGYMTMVHSQLQLFSVWCLSCSALHAACSSLLCVSGCQSGLSVCWMVAACWLVDMQPLLRLECGS